MEALKKAISKDYNAIFSYESDILSAEKNPATRKELIRKKDDLLNFSTSLGIYINSIESLKKFTHGKWLLDIFSKFLSKYISSLSNSCKSNLIYQCKFCKVGHDSCLYQKNSGFNDALVKNDLINSIHINEFSEIYNRAEKLKYIN